MSLILSVLETELDCFHSSVCLKDILNWLIYLSLNDFSLNDFSSFEENSDDKALKYSNFVDKSC